MPIKILVADADQQVQRVLGASLVQAGYDVAAAADGADALRQWRAERPGLILISASLPVVDGFTVLAQIQAEETGGHHTAAIALLAEGQADQRVKALRSGADDYLMKPFHPAELMARMKSLLARFAPDAGAVVGAAIGPEPAKTIVFYGAKGGVGTTTLAINTAIALQKELRKKVCVIDGNLQFGDHRVFLDLTLDRKSIVDLATSPTIDSELVSQVLIPHPSGISLLLAPPSPETAELVLHDHVPQVLEHVSSEFDYVVIDVDKRLDETNLRIMDSATILGIVLTADLPCLKNVRMVLETIRHLGYEEDKVKLILNRSNAFTGINVKNAEGALKRRIDYQVVNEYRTAIGALNSGAPFMFDKAESVLGRNLLELAKGLDRDAAERHAKVKATAH